MASAAIFAIPIFSNCFVHINIDGADMASIIHRDPGLPMLLSSPFEKNAFVRGGSVLTKVFCLLPLDIWNLILRPPPFMKNCAASEFSRILSIVVLDRLQG